MAVPAVGNGDSSASDRSHFGSSHPRNTLPSLDGLRGQLPPPVARQVGTPAPDLFEWGFDPIFDPVRQPILGKGDRNGWLLTRVTAWPHEHIKLTARPEIIGGRRSLPTFFSVYGFDLWTDRPRRRSRPRRSRRLTVRAVSPVSRPISG
jgi:hypothetical protein